MSPDLLHRLFNAPPGKVMFVLLAVLIAAAVYDVRYRKIPNWLSMTGIVLGFAINFAIGPPEAGVMFALKGFAWGFGVYLALYVLRAMGAGDVKLMGAVGALVGAERWFGIFLVTAIVGGLMALLLVTARGRLKKTMFNVGFILSELTHGRPAYAGKEELDVRTKKGASLPHGAVIAVSTVFYIALAASVNR